MLWLYRKSMRFGTPVINRVLSSRLRKGKEHAERINERRGIPSLPRPSGSLIWVNVVSVGEAQSMLILINRLLAENPMLHILVTSVTTTSASLLSERLPERAFHQFTPVDHPDWIRRFLDHWRPDLILWAESELWPNMLHLINKRHIPCALINAHMSPRSHRNWSLLPKVAEKIVNCFSLILAQTEQDADFYKDLGARAVTVTGNIKYSAQPLPVIAQDFKDLQDAINGRPTWLYASSHADEEVIAADIHKNLSQKIPNLLTIVAPRHPQRRDEISMKLEKQDVSFMLRGEIKNLPTPSHGLYVVDTMGELGLLYRVCPITIIGRCFSNDGGGGHNPLEAALLSCAVIQGPKVQNLQEIFDDMSAANASLRVQTPDELESVLLEYLTHTDKLTALRTRTLSYATTKTHVLEDILFELEPLFLRANLLPPKIKQNGGAV
jgi:3-deoxy-D-manno-octulosonic-acid transferase